MTISLKTDVLVAGSGCAGCIAALAAARHGASVVLVERLPHLGGNSTAVLDTFYAFHKAGENGAKIVAGLPDLPLEALRKRGKLFARPNSFGSGTGYTYDPDFLRIVWALLMREAGVRVLTHTLLTGADVGNDNRVATVRLASKSGPIEVSASNFVDASGDADLVALAGGQFQPDTDLTQKSTLTFRMTGVDVARFKADGRPHYRQLVERARAEGRLLPGNGGSLHQTVGKDAVLTAMIGVSPPDLADPFELARMELEALGQVEDWVRFLIDYMPGFKTAELSGIGAMSGIRETRRILGNKTLSEDHVIEGRTTDAPIALCGAPIEDLSNENTRWVHIGGAGAYAIDWQCLLPTGLINVAVAGRCLSASHGAHASARSMATCMAMGQAAGTAAAISGSAPLALVAYPALRNVLVADGALLELENAHV